VRTMAHKMSAATSKGTRSQRRCQMAFGAIRQRPPTSGQTHKLLVLQGKSGGGRGIRTPGGLAATAVFKLARVVPATRRGRPHEFGLKARTVRVGPRKLGRDRRRRCLYEGGPSVLRSHFDLAYSDRLIDPFCCTATAT
jgi:hypothetical protein